MGVENHWRQGLQIPERKADRQPGQYCVRPELKTSVNLLDNLHKNKYSGESIRFVQSALHVAGSHQLNEAIKKRRRKFDDEPYIEHPIDMAQEATRMRLHPTIIAACLMHDVAEDVQLGTLKTPENWLEYFDEEFAGYHDKARLMRILRAELKTETLAEKFQDEGERQTVVNHYMNTAIGKTAVGYMRDLRGDKEFIPSTGEAEHIAEVIFDLNRLFSESYIADKTTGEKSFDPSVMVVKILDTWQNLKTPGFWRDQLANEEKDAKTVAKLVRARVLTNVAEFLGMRKVASEMTQALSAVQNVDAIDFPMLGKLIKNGGDERREMVERQVDLDEQMKTAKKQKGAVEEMLDLAGFKKRGVGIGFQMPWGEPRIFSEGNEQSKMNNIIYFAPSEPRKRTKIRKYSSHGFGIYKRPLAIRNGVIRPSILTLCGRETDDYLLENERLWGSKKSRIRIEDSTMPRLISTLKAKELRPAKQQKVPEKGIFHPGVCKYVGSSNNEAEELLQNSNVDPSLMQLVNFMLSPHKYVRNATNEKDVPYVIFINGKMFLATNRSEENVWRIARNEGINVPVVVPIASSFQHRAKRNDDHILDRLRRNGKLNDFNAVEIKDAQHERKPRSNHKTRRSYGSIWWS